MTGHSFTTIVISMTYKHIVSSFANSTTAHGVPTAVNGQSRKGRIKWSVVIAICFVIFVVQMVDLVKLYLIYETIVQVELGYKTLPFPAVTVCNLNPFRMSMLREVPELAALLAAFDSATDGGSSSNRKRRSAFFPVGFEENYTAASNGVFAVNYTESVFEDSSLEMKRKKRITCGDPFQVVGSMCYTTSNEIGAGQKSHGNAATVCANNGAQLVVLISETETNSLITWINDNHYDNQLWTALKHDSAANELRWHLPNAEQLLVGYAGSEHLVIDSNKLCYVLQQDKVRLKEEECDNTRNFICQKEQYDECPIGSTSVDNYCYSIMATGSNSAKINFVEIESMCTMSGGRMPVLRNEAENVAFGDYLVANALTWTMPVYLAIEETSGGARYWKINGVTETLPITYDATIEASTGPYFCYASGFGSYQWKKCSSLNRRIVCQFDRAGSTTTLTAAASTTTTGVDTSTTTTEPPTTTTAVQAATTTTSVPLTTTSATTTVTTTTVPATTTSTTAPPTTTSITAAPTTTSTTVAPTTTYTTSAFTSTAISPTTAIITPATDDITTAIPVETTPADHCVQLSLLIRGTGPTYSNSDRPVGATAQFTCDNGMVLSGNAIITCNSGGVWSSSPPACKAQCQAISLDASLNISIYYSDPSYLQSSIAVFSCDDDTPTAQYILVPTTSTCLDDGTWSLPLPSQCISMSQQTKEDMQTTISVFAEVANDTMALQQTVTDTMAYFSAGLSKEQVTRLGYQFEELVVNCRYAGARCKDEDFQYMYDPTFSNCYSFNNQDPPTYTTSRAGANEVELYVNQSDYMSTTERGGAMVIVHDQQETVVGDTMGYNVPMGYLTSFGVMLTRVERLAAPYSDCVKDESNDKLFYFSTKYSIEGCYRSCYQKNLIDKCSCGDPRIPIPAGGKFCSVIQRSCIQNFVADKTAIDTLLESCDCPEPCRKGNEMEQLTCYNRFRKDYGRVEIYFVQMNYKMLAESAAFTFTQLLSASGGNLGLFIGVSAITFMEVGHLISALVAYATCKKMLY